MKAIKGDPGYIRAEKKKRGLRTALAFGIVLVILITGYMINGTKLNWLTLVAVLGCLPAAKVLVSLIVMLRYQSIDTDIYQELAGKTEQLTMVYETIITSRDHIMPVDIFAISNHTICGYTHYDKVDVNETAKYVKDMLMLNKYSNISVKIFTDYKAFSTRAEGMNNIAAIDCPDSKEQETGIKQLLLNISL